MTKQNNRTQGQNVAINHWLKTHMQQWRNIENQINAANKTQNNVQDARNVLYTFRALMQDLPLARIHMPGGRITQYLESQLIKTHELIYRPPNHVGAQLMDLYCVHVPQLIRKMRAVLIYTGLLFSFAILVGWLTVYAEPELATLFASTEMINQVQSGKLWTDGLLNIAPSSIISLGIIANNITVSLFAFALGALYGLGTLYIVSLNGLMLGSVFAFTRHYQLDFRLFEFVVAHGVVELSVIIIAAAMGLQLGEALIRPGDRNRLQAFRQTTLDAARVLFAAVPFLILAGLIEGFISPDPAYGLWTRIIVGLCSGILFWLIMLYGLPRQQR